MKRLLRLLLSLNSLRKEIGFSKFFQSIKFDYHLQKIKTLDFKKVLVLAPHPDDEVFGLGGTISFLKNSEANITVCYFCDGSGGIKEMRDEKREMRDNRLAQIRKEEAERAGNILGINKQVFFDHPDGKLASGDSINKTLKSLIEEVSPDIIFTPSFLDNHPDHRAVNEILVNVLHGDEKFEIWAYEIWTPFFPNRIVDISPVIDAKKRAMGEHKSQLDSRGYEKAVLGLNQYRAEINNIEGYAEAFLAASPKIYKELYKKS